MRRKCALFVQVGALSLALAKPGQPSLPGPAKTSPEGSGDVLAEGGEPADRTEHDGVAEQEERALPPREQTARRPHEGVVERGPDEGVPCGAREELRDAADPVHED